MAVFSDSKALKYGKMSPLEVSQIVYFLLNPTEEYKRLIMNIGYWGNLHKA